MNVAKETVIVTGAKGLVGHSICKFLSLNKSVELIEVCHNKFEESYKVDQQLYVDLRNDYNYLVKTISKNVSVIVHCAASIPTDFEGSENSAQINREIDNTILKLCVNYNAKLIFVSSCSVYDLLSKEEITEQSPLKLDNPYSKEKRNSEIMFSKMNVPNVILRINSPYGIGQKNINVLSLFVQRAVEGLDLYYFGDGGRTQIFTCVDDIAECVAQILNSRFKESKILNVVGKESISMKSLAILIKKVTQDSSFEVKRKEWSVDVGNYNLKISNRLAYKEFGWEPKITLEQGLKKMVNEIGHT